MVTRVRCAPAGNEEASLALWPGHQAPAGADSRGHLDQPFQGHQQPRMMLLGLLGFADGRACDVGLSLPLPLVCLCILHNQQA